MRGGYRSGSGRPKGTFKPIEERKAFKTFSISCSIQEYEKIKELAEVEGKTISRFLIDKSL